MSGHFLDLGEVVHGQVGARPASSRGGDEEPQSDQPDDGHDHRADGPTSLRGVRANGGSPGSWCSAFVMMPKSVPGKSLKTGGPRGSKKALMPRPGRRFAVEPLLPATMRTRQWTSRP